MKIKKMTATFGVLDHAVLIPGEGLTVITAPNEAGKSTWAGFLKAMFYGIDTRERDKAGHLADKNRYQPWSGAPMEGELQLEWECQDITLRRFAAKGSPFSGFEAVYTASGDPVPGLTSANVGAAILGVGREVYLRSAFVGQGKAAVTPNGELEARIAALATSGQEDVSYSTVERTLKDWRNRRRANRSNGLLPELEEELAQAEQALQDMGRIRAQAQADQERLASLEAEQQRLKDDVALWDRIEKHDLNRRYGQALADQEAAQAALDALSPPAPEMDGWTAQEAREWAQQEQEQYQAAVDERRKLQEQRDAIQAASQKKARIAVILAAVLAAAGIVLGVLGGLGLATQLPPEVCFYTLLAAFAALIWRNRTLMDAQRKLDGLELPDPPQSQDWSGQAQAHADYLARQERLELELRHASQRVDDLAAQGGRAFDTLEYLPPPARSRVDTAARLARVEAEIAQRRQVLAQSQGRLEQLGNPERSASQSFPARRAASGPAGGIRRAGAGHESPVGRQRRAAPALLPRSQPGGSPYPVRPHRRAVPAPHPEPGLLRPGRAGERPAPLCPVPVRRDPGSALPGPPAGHLPAHPARDSLGAGRRAGQFRRSAAGPGPDLPGTAGTAAASPALFLPAQGGILGLCPPDPRPHPRWRQSTLRKGNDYGISHSNSHHRRPRRWRGPATGVCRPAGPA